MTQQKDCPTKSIYALAKEYRQNVARRAYLQRDGGWTDTTVNHNISIVESWLTALSQKERELVTEHIIKGRTLREISAETGVSYGRLQYIKRKALKRKDKNNDI